MAINQISVLLIDDQRFIGMAVERLLAGEDDITLHCCYAAREAIAEANRVAPAVILQDLILPEIDGAGLIKLFRQNPQTATTPIVVLSGNDDAASRTSAMEAGANDFAHKLPDKATLVACIRQHASGASPSPAPGASVPSPAPASQAAGAALTLDREIIAALRSSLGTDGADVLSKLIEEFLKEAASLVDRLASAAQKADAAMLKAVGHSLKGTCSTMGAYRLAELGGQIEDHAGRTPDVPIDPTLVTSICEEVGRVRRACLSELRQMRVASFTRSTSSASVLGTTRS